ncbi:glycoside hydrolase family 66 protein [Paenibacillus curdlanolyticus]|nr:glycoside hydrolase family 66 protein [Paenibacillus curdlanolyticus]
MKKTILLCTLSVIAAGQGEIPFQGNAGDAQVAHAGAANGIATMQEMLKTVTSISVDKARYLPGEEVTLTIKLADRVDWTGTLNLQIYQINELVASGAKTVAVKQGQGELQVKWKAPERDFTGYLVKASVNGASENDFATAAIDVSSDWKRYPRYGYVSEFPNETAEQSDAKLKQLSQDYYLNGYQFYDWMWRHDVSVYSKTDENGKPLKDGNGNYITEEINASTHYTDLLGRTLYPMSVKQQVESAQKYGSAAMAYQMNYAARENYTDFGVSPEWGLYNKSAQFPLDPTNPQKDQNGFTFEVNGKPTSLFLQDPGNTAWQAYISKQFNRSVNVFGFDGIHLDQWGASDNDFLYDYNGNKRYYSLDYDKLIGAVKDSLVANNPKKSDVTLNMVGGNADYSAVTNPQTKTDFDYSEIWQDRNQYRDLQKVVEDTRGKNGGKAMVIAGYMNYKQATGVTTRGTDAMDVPAEADYQSRITKAYGWVGNFGRKDTDAVTFTVNAPVKGSYELTLNYGQGNGSGYPEGKLTVNGQVAADAIAFDSNTGWGNPVSGSKVNLELEAGTNTVKLTLNTNGLWLNLASLDVKGQGIEERFEAVDAKLDTVIVDQYSNVYNFDTKGDYVTFHVNVPAEGDYPLGFSYASDWQSVDRELVVNDVQQGRVAFQGAGAWDKFTKRENMSTVHLAAGNNTVKLAAPKDDMGIKLQYMTVGANKYYALYADIPQTNSIKQSESKTDNFGQAGQSITYTVNNAQAVDSITVLYHGDNDPVMSVLVDGQPAQQAQNVAFLRTSGGWDGAMQPKTLTVAIPAGKHEVTLKMESSGQYINVGGILVGGFEYSTGSAQGDGGVVPLVGYVYDFNNENDRVVFDVTADAAGSYDLNWVYQNNAPNAGTAIRSVTVGDGQSVPVSFVPTLGNSWQTAVTSGVQLQQGNNRIEIKMNAQADNGIKLDKLTVQTSGSPADEAYAYEAESIREAETFSLYKDTVINFGEIGQQVTYPVTIPQTGEQSLIFTYSNAGASTSRSVYIDGVRAKDAGGNDLKVWFSGTESKDRYSEDGYVIVPAMTAGNHTVTLKAEADDERGTVQLRGVTAGYFNEPSVRLMDAALATMGATHIEIGTAERIEEGPNMLAHEYYPNRSKKMTVNTKEAMKDYYKFFAAYENLLFDSKVDTSGTIGVKDANGDAMQTSKDGTANTLWYTVRTNAGNASFETYDLIHLVSDWRNAANEPALLQDIQVDYALGLTQDAAPNLKVYAATPDGNEGAMKELTYTWNGDHILINVPSVSYWSMLVVDRNPQQGTVQQIFNAGGNSSSSGTGIPVVVPPAADGLKVVTVQELQQANGGKVMIALPSEMKSVRIPAEAGELLGSNKLELQYGPLALSWNAGAIKKLCAGAAKQEGAYLEVKLTPIDNPAKGTPSQAFVQKGGFYSLQMTLKMKDGTTLETESLEPGVNLAYRVDGLKMSGKLLGLYVYDKKSGQWAYAGGHYNTNDKSFYAGLATQGAFAFFEYEKSFVDVPSTHWAFEAVSSLVAKQAIKGVTEFNFAPSETSSRAQIAAMVARALNLESKGSDASFIDVPATAWYAEELTAAYETGLVQGSVGGKFMPNAPITRQELAVMLVRAYSAFGSHAFTSKEREYTDADQIAAWAKDAVKKATEYGLLQGLQNGEFAPTRNCTRSEVAMALDNLLNRVNNSSI